MPWLTCPVYDLRKGPCRHGCRRRAAAARRAAARHDASLAPREITSRPAQRPPTSPDDPGRERREGNHHDWSNGHPALPGSALSLLAATVFIMGAGQAARAGTDPDRRLGTAQRRQRAGSGQESLNSAKLAVEQINAKGGVLGRPLQIVEGDDRCDPKESAIVAQKFVAQKINAAASHCTARAPRWRRCRFSARRVSSTPIGALPRRRCRRRATTSSSTPSSAAPPPVPSRRPSRSRSSTRRPLRHG